MKKSDLWTLWHSIAASAALITSGILWFTHKDHAALLGALVAIANIGAEIFT